MGYDDCIPSMYLSSFKWEKVLVEFITDGGCFGFCGFLDASTDTKDSYRKSNRSYQYLHQETYANNPTVAIWTWRDQADLFVAKIAAEIEADESRRRKAS